jgi:Bacterial Ig-like domain (group 3)
MYLANAFHTGVAALGRRGGAFALAVLAILFLASVLPPLGPFSFLPIATVATGGDGRGPPESDIAPLGEFTPTQVVQVAYTSYLYGRGDGDDDDDDDDDDDRDDVGARGLGSVAVGPLGVSCGRARQWTELFYRTNSDVPWALYAPPWNACGHWVGTRRSGGVVEGTIPFDSSFTGGEGPYEFVTVAVRRETKREPMSDAPKARTTVDYHAPQLFLGSPVAEAWTNRDLLRWDARDAISGVAAVSFSLNGSAPIPLDAASGERALGVAEGTHTVLVAATDRAGNRADVRATFHFDPTAPTLAFNASARDAFFRSDDVAINWTARAEGAPLTSLRLTIDSDPPVDLPTDATSYPLTDLDERGHHVSLLAIDAAGNLATDSLSFGVDATPPTVTVVGPSRPYANTRDLRVFWVGSDAVSGIDHYELSLDGTFVVSVPDVSGYEFPQISEGTHSVGIRAFDRAGNFDDTTFSVTVDRTAPTVSVTKPATGATVYGTVEVEWSLDDDRSGIDPLQTFFDFDEFVVPARAPDTTKATVSPANTGPHFVLVGVMDRAGNPAQAGVAFTYGGRAPPGPFGLSALDFTLLILAIVAIAVLAAYVAVRRRRPRTP